eukprot:scaffold1533_cov157-Amphora_coffeaeformis.AAC.5
MVTTPLRLCAVFVAVLWQQVHSESNGNVCKPLPLKINTEKVQHRPPRLTIAHRGASANLPEHTLAGYRLALELGADFVEPDLLPTADNQLIVMHDMDLETATDVRDKFPDRQPWFSPFANRTGFWVFNFTAAEIATLSVKQLRSTTRSTLYDGLWGVPTLTDVLNLVNNWNNNVLPYRLPDAELHMNVKESEPRKPTMLQLLQSGIYAELKDAWWVQSEVGINLADLLMQHVQENLQAWQTLIPCFDEIQFDAYKVPGLVVQSFQSKYLQHFHDKWQAEIDPTIMPEPPYVLLVDKLHCQDESLWFEVGDDSREFLSGIGCDKSCLIADEPYTLTAIKAEEFSLVVHAYTELPEAAYVTDQNRFADDAEEMEYLYCHVGIQGVFAESVAEAVTAATLPCDHTKHKKQPPQSSGTEQEDGSLCYDSTDQASLFFAGAAFVMGVFLTVLFFVGCGRYHMRWQSNVVPSHEDTIVYAPRSVHHDNSGSISNYKDDDVSEAVATWRKSQINQTQFPATAWEEEGLHDVDLEHNHHLPCDVELT